MTATIELHLDKRMIERVQDVATRRQSTIETLIEQVIELLAAGLPDDTLLGMFSQEPEIIDHVTESAMLTRETATRLFIDQA